MYSFPSSFATFRSLSLRVSLIIGAIATHQIATAQTSYWIGGSGDWGTLANWTAFPFNGPHVVIGSSYGNPTYTTVGGTSPTGPDNWGYSGSYYPYEHRIKSLQSTGALIVNAPKEHNGTLWIQEGGSISNTLTIRGGIMSGNNVDPATLSVTGLTTWESGDLAGNMRFLGGLTVTAAGSGRTINGRDQYSYWGQSSVDLYSTSNISGSISFGPAARMRNYGTLNIGGAYFNRQVVREFASFENYGTVNFTENSTLQTSLHSGIGSVLNIASGKTVRADAGSIEGTVNAAGAKLIFSSIDDMIPDTSLVGANITADEISLQYGRIYGGTTINAKLAIGGIAIIYQPLAVKGLSLSGNAGFDSYISTGSHTLTSTGLAQIYEGRLEGNFDLQGGLKMSSASVELAGANVRLDGISSISSYTAVQGSGSGSRIENYGDLTIDRAYFQHSSGNNKLVNFGSLTEKSYSSFEFNFENHGRVKILGDMDLTGGGKNKSRLFIGSQGSTLVSSKAFTLTSTSILEFEVGTSSFGTLDVTGTTVVLNGYVSGLLAPGTTIADGSIFRVINGNYSGVFATRGLHWQVIYGANFVDLKYVQSVPEPGSLALLGIGMAAFVKRRRKS